MAGFETIIVLRSEAATQALGARIAPLLAPGSAVLLSGELGAGKTALARAILRARGVDGIIPSPTFTLVQRYETESLVLHHFDLYRIEDASEMVELGLDDALEEGAVLIEWPERAELRISGALAVTLAATGPGAREARIGGPEQFRPLLAETT